MERFKLLIRIVICALLVAVPLFFTTITSEYFELPKTFLIYGAFFATLLLLGLKFFLSKNITFTRTTFDLSLFLLLITFAVSTYFGANRVQSLMNGLAPLSVGILLYFVVTNLLDPLEETDYKIISRVFVASVTLLGILAFFSYFNLNIFPFDFAKNRFFTPAGSDLTLILLLAIAAPLSLGALLHEDLSFKSPWYYIFSANLLFFGLLIILQTSVLGALTAIPTISMLFLTDKESLSRQRSLISSIGLALFLVIILFYLPLNFNKRFVDFRGSFPRAITLDMKSSWIVSIQTIRDYPIFGSGPATYLADFVRYRPAFLNYTPFWAQRFSAASGEPYQSLATLGVLGFLVFLFFVYKLLTTIVKLLASSSGKSDGIAFSIMAFLIALLFSVPSASLRTVFFILLAVYTLKSLPVVRKQYNILPVVPLILVVIINISLGFLVYTMVLAEFSFKKAIDAVGANDTQGAIQGLSDAIKYNQYRDNYHLSLASLAYTLANNLAAKKDPTDADRQTLIQLLNTATSEAKIAVSLDPFNGSNLEALSSIYRNIAGAVQNAATWAVTAYQQAIQIEPTNSNLHFQLGSLFFAGGNYEMAANYFSQAVQLKNDMVNYHYNLAWALRARGIMGSAIDEMTVVSRLVAPESEDGKKAAADLADFQKLAEDIAAKSANIPAQAGQPSTSGELDVPQPESNLAKPTQPKVNLPTEASPSSVNRK